MFLRMNVFTLCIRLACDSQRHERLLRIRYWFTSNHIPFLFDCRPREASRLEAKTHEAEAKTYEAEAEAEATTHEAETEAETRFFGLEAEARPRGLTSLKLGLNLETMGMMGMLRGDFFRGGVRFCVRVWSDDEFWLISSGLHRKAQGKNMYPGFQEQKERSDIDGLWCMYRTVMRKDKT